jgi:hypothetical protein
VEPKNYIQTRQRALLEEVSLQGSRSIRADTLKLGFPLRPLSAAALFPEALDKLMKQPYQLEGFHLWNTPMEKWYTGKQLVVDEGGRVYTYNPSLKRRINGILNIRKRYAPLLHKKLEIFYSELTGYAQKNGRFKNASQAVQLILPTLQIKFREFDLQWVQSRLETNKQKILDLTEARKNNENKETCEDDDFGVSFKIQDRTYLNQIRELQNENKKWEQFLQHPERYFPQQKQLPFNTAYCDEVLVNHLRRRPDLLKEIIQVQL